jgi:hypothetical protein
MNIGKNTISRFASMILTFGGGRSKVQRGSRFGTI